MDIQFIVSIKPFRRVDQYYILFEKIGNFIIVKQFL